MSYCLRASIAAASSCARAGEDARHTHAIAPAIARPKPPLTKPLRAAFAPCEARVRAGPRSAIESYRALGGGSGTLERASRIHFCRSIDFTFLQRARFRAS